MRRNTKIIMIATALAFAALMVFEWGMDATGRSGAGGQVGTVNGTPINADQYNRVYQSLYDQRQASQEVPLTSLQIKEIEDEAFEELVTQILISQELDRRGIRVADEEVRNAAQFNPPPQFLGEPSLQTDGQFDLQKYQQFLASQPDAFLLQLEAYYRDVIPRSKLLRQVSSGIYVTDQELWRRWRDQQETIEVRFIPLDPTTRIADDEVELTEREIRAYYDAHQDEFMQPARARVIATVIDKTPTPADTVAQYERAVEIVESLRRGDERFEDVAAAESSDRSTASDGGDLGTFTPGTMVPVFDSAVFAGPVGEPFGPVVTSFGNHVIEVTERWGQDSVTARHILIPYERTDASELRLLTRADSLEELGESLPLIEAATALGLSTTEADISLEFALIGGAGDVSEGADWALNEAEIGDVSPVFETASAFYALELLSTTPEGVLPFEDARVSIEQTLLSRKKLAAAEEEGRAIVERIRGGESLPNVADELGLDVRLAGPFSRVDFAPGLGRQNAAIGAAFGLEPGEVTDPVSTFTNTFIIELIRRTPADSAAWLAQKDFQREQLTRSVSQDRLTSWVDGLREDADVRDLRRELEELQGLPTEPQYGFGTGLGF
ncbi:MAG: SurA N-terminal domain-containing protein [Longimicrobiales bacterium]|nr:SurA N-terminal domain-containing protein [Longimicrobiales bacterium]